MIPLKTEDNREVFVQPSQVMYLKSGQWTRGMVDLNSPELTEVVTGPRGNLTGLKGNLKVIGSPAEIAGKFSIPLVELVHHNQRPTFINPAKVVAVHLDGRYAVIEFGAGTTAKVEGALADVAGKLGTGARKK